MIFPFAILFCIVFYLIYSRQKFEKKVYEIYEDKFEDWKKHSAKKDEEIEEKKELVGLVFKTGLKTHIELFDESCKDRILRGKFEIKVK